MTKSQTRAQPLHASPLLVATSWMIASLLLIFLAACGDEEPTQVQRDFNSHQRGGRNDCANGSTHGCNDSN